MSRKIIGVTVGTPISPSKIEAELKPVKTVNGVTPDENGNVKITIPDSDGDVDLTGYATEEWVQSGYQPKGNYLEKNKYIDWFGTGTSIPKNDNLDTYKTNGKFYANSESIAASLSGRPDGMNTNFCMFVFDRTNGVKSQLMITLAGKMYIRSTTTTAWRNWVAYTTSDEIASLMETVKQEILEDVSGGTVDLSDYVKTINGTTPDDNGNVDVVGISYYSVDESSDGTKGWTIHLTNGETVVLSVSNGKDGTDGTDGKDGCSVFPFDPTVASLGDDWYSDGVTIPDGRTLSIGDILFTTEGKFYRLDNKTMTGFHVSYLCDIGGSGSGVYTLAEGETIEDVPEWAEVVVDPNAEPYAVEMVATFDDGSETTFKLYGEAVTG